MQILGPAALVVAGIACGSTPAVTSSPTLILPADESAPVLAPSPSVASPARHASPASAPIAWMTSESDARDRARRQNLPILVYIRADWAAACLEMERGAWRDPRVIDAARGFVPLQLDVSEAAGNAELYAQLYDVSSIPKILVLDPSGRTVATNDGGASVVALVTLLRDTTRE